MLIKAHQKGKVSIWLHHTIDIGVIYGHDGTRIFKGTKIAAMKQFLLITE